MRSPRSTTRRPLSDAFAPVVLALAVAAGALGACGGGPTERSADAPNEVLAQQWWRWVGGAPDSADLMSDPDGRFCTDDQSEDGMWFLASTTAEAGAVERTCKVPVGRPLFVPVLNRICDAGESTAEECVMNPLDLSTATLDGTPLEIIRITNSESFTVGFGHGNPLAPSGGIAKVFADGWWVRIPAPPAGDHELVITGDTIDRSVGLEYRLIITEE